MTIAMTTEDYVRRYVLPSAYALLPPEMTSDAASALLIAIGRQESRFQHRRQIRGPARSFWQFETGGVMGVMNHRDTRELVVLVAGVLKYPVDVISIHQAMEHNDVLAAAMARLLLWTVPDALPGPTDADTGWQQYLAAWRPGRPHPTTWADHYRVGWATDTRRA